MKDYYGWRARLGLIYMSSSTVMEPEFSAMCPEGVSFHTARIHLPAPTIDGLTRMMQEEEIERCVVDLARAPLHAIVFGGTSATFLEGLEWDQKVISWMQAKSAGIPVTTTSTCCLDALKAIEAHSVSIVTPYVEEVTERAARFFSENGFDVRSATGMGIAEDHGIAAITTEELYRFARSEADRGADALFISCTNLRTIGAIAALEEDLDMPVITAIQASFWGTLRLAGVRARRHGFGRLLNTPGI